MDWGNLKDDINNIIFQCRRETKTCYEQYAFIRNFVAEINKNLRTIQNNVTTLDASKENKTINCFYELTVNFLCAPPVKTSTGKRDVLFKNPSRCNKIEVLMYLVKEEDTQQRFLIGSKIQYDTHSSSSLNVNRIPKFHDDLVVNYVDDGQKEAKRQMTANNWTTEYFTGVKVASILFNMMVIIMLMIKQDMEVSKHHVATDFLCAPYEQIYDVERQWNKKPKKATSRISTMTEDQCDQLRKQYTEKIKTTKKILKDRIRASYQTCRIYGTKNDDDVLTIFYADEACEQLTNALKTFKSKMDDKKVSVNLFRFKICQVCALQDSY